MIIFRHGPTRPMRRLLPDGQITRSADLGVSSPPQENISLCPSGKSSLQARAIPPLLRGAFRDRHERWVRDAVDALAQRTNALEADGQAVWS
jgi:hypothetical protein